MKPKKPRGVVASNEGEERSPAAKSDGASQYRCVPGQRVTYHRSDRFQQGRSGPFDARR